MSPPRPFLYIERYGPRGMPSPREGGRTMGKSYTMTIAGLTRELPLCPISDKLDIAAFVIFGDVPLTVAAAEALLKRRRRSTFC